MPGSVIFARERKRQLRALIIALNSYVEKPGLLLPAACCKICSKGKACSNTCISRSKTCHKPPGCACDAQ